MAAPRKRTPARPPTDASGQSLLWAVVPVEKAKPKRRTTPARVEAVEAEDVARMALEVAADELRLWSLLLPDESEAADAALNASELVREALVLLDVARRGVRAVARENRISLPPG